MRLRENSRSASAEATFLPRMSCATRLSFCGLMRIIRITAMASFSGRSRSRFFLLIARTSLACGCRRARAATGGAARAFGLAVRGVAIEHARRRELAELVAYHLLGDHDGDVLLPIVDAERQPDELRQDRRAPAPDLDHLVPA